jgi:hypothetical protein
MAAIDETGMLRRDGGGFALLRDAGGRYRLELGRTPGEHVETRVRGTGRLGGDGVVEVGELGPA